MARVYVGAKFEEAVFAKVVMANLQAAGHEITHDWTGETVEGLRGVEVLDVLQQAGVDDVEGVRSADALVLIHHDNLRGGLVELGVALGNDIPVFIIDGSGWAYPMPFYVHPDVIHVSTVGDVLTKLAQLFPGEQAEEECCGGCGGCC